MRLYDPIQRIPGIRNMPALAAVLKDLEGTDVAHLAHKNSDISLFDFIRSALVPHLPPGTPIKMQRDHNHVDHRGVMYRRCIDFMVYSGGHWWVVIRCAQSVGTPTQATLPDSTKRVVFGDVVRRAKEMIARNWMQFTATQRLYLRLVLDGSDEKSIRTILGVQDYRVCKIREQVSSKISSMLKAA